MIKENKFLLIFFGILLVSSVFVFAYPGIEVFNSDVVESLNLANWTEDLTFPINITINNTNEYGDAANITQVNITLPSGCTRDGDSANNYTNANGSFYTFTNYSDTILSWYNTSTGIGYLINGSNTTAWFAFNMTCTTPGFYKGIYNLTVAALHNGTTNYTALNFTINDTTSPDFSTPVAPVNNGNYSGTLVLNMSITDNWLNNNWINGPAQSVYVNLTVWNASGSANASYKATNVTGDYWNVSIDTTQFPDGLYNLTVYFNDTSGNLNSTNITLVRFDNTAPTGSISCTPSSVNAGETVTCSCSPSDGGSDVNSSATSYTSSIITSNTGTYTVGCSFGDLAGNTASTSTTYNVELASSGGSSSGGSATVTSWTKTIPVGQDLSVIQNLNQQLKAKERIRIKINEEVHHIGIVELTLTTATIEIASDPVQVELDIGEDVKVDLDEDGIYDVYVKLNSIVDGKADLTVKYSTEEVPAEKESSVETTGEIVGDETPEEPIEEEQGLTWLWIMIGVIVVIILVGIGYKVKNR